MAQCAEPVIGRRFAPTRWLIAPYTLFRSPFPGRDAARSAASQNPDRIKHRPLYGPGSAVHRSAKGHSASKTRVNALMALHRVRETTKDFRMAQKLFDGPGAPR